MARIDWEGVHRGRALSWDLYQGENSKSVAINITFEATEFLGEKDAHGDRPWQPIDPSLSYGSIWIIGKDGLVKTAAVERACSVLDWDGMPSSVVSHPTLNKPCQFTVKKDSYNGKESYKVAWVDPFDFKPSVKSEYAADESAAQGLDNLYGSEMRAIAASVKAKQPAPAPVSTEDPVGESAQDGSVVVPF